MIYETREEANLKIANSVILYEDNPIYVKEIKEDMSVVFWKLPFIDMANDKTFKIKLNNEKLSMRDFNIGYVNPEYPNKNKAIFLFRKPVRKSRQGICGENLFSYNYEGGGENRVGMNSLLYDKGFVSMFKNSYPTFEEAAELLTKDESPKRIAFHRDFALEKDPLGVLFVYYRGQKVAWGNLGRFVAPAKFEFLKEVSNISGVNIHEFV